MLYFAYRIANFLASRTDILANRYMFDNTPVENCVVRELLHLGIRCQFLISIILDSFHGVEAASYGIFFSATNRQNAIETPRAGGGGALDFHVDGGGWGGGGCHWGTKT